ncbi:MAG: dCMP deaminase family protein [Richelia sp. RM2_1_2]|nr:dCMP deaminase family protein [Richelia sp. RM2_1_2]
MTTLHVPSWDQYFMSLAHLIARKSKDQSTKTGAIIVGPDNEIRSTGYNGFPRHVHDDDVKKHTAPNKYMWTEHAERNAIYNAARVGISLDNCIMYVTWHPCHDCARAIVSAGIVCVVVHKNFEMIGRASGDWDESQKIAQAIFDEAGVTIRFYEGPLVGIQPLKGRQLVNLEII